MSPSNATAGWRAAHVGFEEDGLRIGGVDVWGLPWRSAAGQSVELPHPAHPRQMHRFGIHEIGDPAHPVRFAACELSNGVWGFYVPVDTPAESEGVWLKGTQICRHVSPDGSIEVDLAAVEWSNSHWVNSPRVTDLAGDRIVLDLWNTDWDASVSFPGKRQLRLGFRRYLHAGHLAVELDLAAGTFRIFAGPGLQDVQPDAPLSQIANALEVASRRAEEHAHFIATRDGLAPTVRRPHALAAWRTALVILMVALVAISLLTWVALRIAPEERPKLDTVPGMPK